MAAVNNPCHSNLQMNFMTFRNVFPQPLYLCMGDRVQHLRAIVLLLKRGICHKGMSVMAAYCVSVSRKRCPAPIMNAL